MRCLFRRCCVRAAEPVPSLCGVIVRQWVILFPASGVTEVTGNFLLGDFGQVGSVPPHLVTYAFGDKRRKIRLYITGVSV